MVGACTRSLRTESTVANHDASPDIFMPRISALNAVPTERNCCGELLCDGIDVRIIEFGLHEERRTASAAIYANTVSFPTFVARIDAAPVTLIDPPTSASLGRL